MKAKRVAMWLIPVAVAAAGIYEAQYSSDMREHIDTVNEDLRSAGLEASIATGLAGSLQTLTAEAQVAGEIIDTRDHVHTVRDELLARKIRQAVADGVTVGRAIQSVIAVWPEASQ